MKKGKTKLTTYAPAKKAPVKKTASPPPRKNSKGKMEAKMEQSIDNSSFSGLATVVEMMMDQNCPADLHTSDGLGADNMTCIIVELGKSS